MNVTEWHCRVEESDKAYLRQRMLADNIRRGRALALFVIVFETVLVAIDIGASLLKVDQRFHFSLYLAMYLLMIAINVAFYCLTGKASKTENLPPRSAARLEGLVVCYVVLLMCWGSTVSLMDQRLYGHLMVFMVNMITGSIIYSLNTRQILIPYLASTAILLIGLPFFQRSSDVLIGHYVNVLVFIAVSWIASRILYSRFCKDFRSALLLKRANEQLELEIARNHEANLQLADANRQLQLLSLQDELTGLANRRSFRNFVERMFDEGVPAGTSFSVAMIDLDHFKEFNDSYGHNGGDQALAAVAGEIKSVVRHSKDIAARWGGEEFVYAAFGMDAGEIETVAETIRMRVAALAIPHGPYEDGGIVTVSVGACTNPVHDKSDVSKCIDRADKAMYRAKAGGRNRTQNS